MRSAAALLTIAALSAAPLEAHAQLPESFKTNDVIDGSVVIGCFAGGLLFALLPVDIERRVDAEFFAFDSLVRGQFSASAHAASNTLIFATVLTPLTMHIALGVNDQLSKVAIVYTESLAVSYLLNAAAKHLVQRPRPYLYSEDAFVQTYAKREGIDTHLSFYSGHAAVSFTAAVGGSFLYGLRSKDEEARALVWGFNLAMAAATSNLRVRAGKHYYSDIFVGALMGAASGILVPMIHMGGNFGGYEPSVIEGVSIAGGIALGVLISQLAPMDRDIVLPLEVVPESNERETSLQLRLDVQELLSWL